MGTRHTVDTLRLLLARLPNRFIWLMGADTGPNSPVEGLACPCPLVPIA